MIPAAVAILSRHLPDHEVKTTYKMGWGLLKNGLLLSRKDEAVWEFAEAIRLTPHRAEFHENLRKVEGSIRRR